MKHEEKLKEQEGISISSWKFLINDISEDSLLLDCRTEEEFLKKTIKGAYSAALVRKPSGSSDKSLLKVSSFLKAILDIAQNYKKIIIFDEGLGMFSGKLAFLLKGLDVKEVYILNKLFQEIEENQLSAGEESKILQPIPNMKKPLNLKEIVPIVYVQQNLVKVQLIDVRTKEEFEGNIPSISNPQPRDICGKIPGAIHFDWLDLYDNNGYLLPKQEIITKLKKASLILERPTILYDYNGARASFMALVLKDCKYRNVKVYLGSWLEWQRTKLPKQNFKLWYPDN